MPTGYCMRGGEQGLIEKLDFSKIPNAAAMPEAYRNPYSVAYEFYSSVLAYSQKKYPEATAPNSWADFWDVKKFPGRRALRNHPLATLEAALMADGVAPDKLYPLDVDRAFKKLEEIKPQHHGLVDLGRAIRAAAQRRRSRHGDGLERPRQRAVKEGAKVAYTYNQGILQSTSLCILKGAPNLATAVKFLNEAVDPVHQANLPLHIDYGPAQPEGVRYRRDQAGARRGTAERAGQRQEAGADVLRMVDLAGRRSRREALGLVRPEIGGPSGAGFDQPEPRSSHPAMTGKTALTHSTPDLSLRHHRREQGLMLALASPALLVILLLIVLPLGWLAWQSIYHDGFTLENYRRIFSEAIYWRSFSLTFQISLLVTLLALLLGYPVAYAASVVPTALERI